MIKKIGCIVQARMGSHRLPGKSLMKLAGKPVIQHVVERIKACKTFDNVVVATTVKKEDDAIELFCKEFGVDCFRGSENNVLKRYFDCARAKGFDVVIRVCGDCPLIDSKVIDLAVRLFLKGGVDYVSNTLVRSFPKGLDVEVFSFAALEKAFTEAVSKEDLEHVTLFIMNNPHKFKLDCFFSKRFNPEEKLCIDTIEDFKKIEIMVKNEYEEAIKELLKRQRRPLSTFRISHKTGISWPTTRKYLQRLERKGQVKKAKRGRKIFWEI